MKQKTLGFKEEILEKVKVKSEELGISQSDIIRLAVGEYLTDE